MRLAVVLALLTLPTLTVAQTRERGSILFLQCRACHTLKLGEPDKVGPNLHRMFTRAPLAAPGYTYSVAFVAAKPRWTPMLLDRWLERPGAMLKGTTMAFGGIAKSNDRTALIAWLQATTK